MNINVQIERLILDGMPMAPAERPLLQAAVETELAQLLATNGLGPGLMTGGAMPGLRAGGIQLQGGEDPIHLGAQIAQAVYEGIGR
jgi:hypothetical protein